MSSLVLVQNEVTYEGQYDHWQDFTGVSYQFPNQYRKKITPGRRFIYYRGVRRANNQRGVAEYFGVGRISSVWRDSSVPESVPKARWRWFCAIEDYIPFFQPVPSKLEGKYFENISTALGWRTAVREIPDEVLDKVLELAGVEYNNPRLASEEVPSHSSLRLPDISEVVPIELPKALEGMIQFPTLVQGPSERTTISSRRTKHSKQIGDRAEEIVLKWLQAKSLPGADASIIWVAKQGKTPGWDIEFMGEDGTRICVEVKGTTGGVFQSIEITAREWDAAKEMRDRYWLVLVTNCLSKQPRVNLIQDPYGLFVNGNLEIEPLLWRIRRASTRMHS